MQEDQKEAAVDALLLFMQKMHKWEKKYYPLMAKDTGKFADEAIADLTKFYESFVLRPDSKGRIHSPYPGNPPEYDPSKEPIDDVKIDGQKILIETHQEAGFREKFRYTMQQSENVWKITRKDVYDTIKDKWSKFLL